jgi:type IV pilus biogenesis protein CpaD/CtpE
MNAMRQCLVIMVLANATLAGCASTPTDHPSSRAQDVDTARVERIDSIARHHGIEVYWVNYPLKSPQ